MLSRAFACAAVAASLVVACGGADDADEFGVSSDEALTKVSPAALLTDDQVEGRQDITVEQMQKFLESQGSYLAHYEDGAGKTSAQIIVDAAHAHHINPIYLVARIQGESSLIQSGSSRGLSTATGCACPDGAACSRAQSGFAKQVECSSALMRAYFDELDTDHETRAGYGVGKKSRTLDPCSVTPQNRATAALYTYTPWVGPYSTGCGSRRSGGGTLLAVVYKRFLGDPAFAPTTDHVDGAPGTGEPVADTTP